MKPKNILKRIRAFLKNNLPPDYQVQEVSYESPPGFGYYIAIKKDGLSSGVNLSFPPDNESMKMIIKHLLFMHSSKSAERIRRKHKKQL